MQVPEGLKVLRTRDSLAGHSAQDPPRGHPQITPSPRAWATAGSSGSGAPCPGQGATALHRRGHR